MRRRGLARRSGTFGVGIGIGIGFGTNVVLDSDSDSDSDPDVGLTTFAYSQNRFLQHGQTGADGGGTDLENTASTQTRLPITLTTTEGLACPSFVASFVVSLVERR